MTPPIIDLKLGSSTDLPVPSDHRQRLVSEIGRAMTASGFLYIAGHGIPTDTIARLRAAQRAFFAQSLDEKQRVAIGTDNRGYLADGQARMHGARQHDQKEVFFWGAELPEDHPDRVAGVPLCGPNRWPAIPADFRDAVLDYTRAAQTAGAELLRLFAQLLDAPLDTFERHYQSPMSRGQLIRYPPTRGGEHDFGVAPHTDFGCITLLLQETPGLEALSKEGTWIEVPPVDGTLVVNIGDLLEHWSDGRLPSTKHRVRNVSKAERYSVALFHDPDPTAVVDAAELGANSGRFTPIAAADYIVSRNRGAFSHYGEIDSKAT